VIRFVVAASQEYVNTYSTRRSPSRTLAFTRYSFTSKLYCGSQIILLLPLPPTCKAYPLAILLHDHCAIYVPPPPPALYAIHHTILVITYRVKAKAALPPLVQSTGHLQPFRRFDSRNHEVESLRRTGHLESEEACRNSAFG